MMTKKDKIAVVFGLNGQYYDAIMNAMPEHLLWIDSEKFDAEFEDWFYSQLGF